MFLFRSKTAILCSEIDFLRAQVAQLQSYIFAAGMAPPPVAMGRHTHSDPEWDGAPIADIQEHARRMYSTELEEDVEYQLQEGLIGEEEASRLLREAGALDDDIELN